MTQKQLKAMVSWAENEIRLYKLFIKEVKKQYEKEKKRNIQN